jgi:chromosome partitioning protein
MAIVSRWGEGIIHPCESPGTEERKDVFTRLRNIFYKQPGPSPEDILASLELKNEQKRLSTTLAVIKQRFPSVYTVPFSPAVYEAQKRGLPISHFAPDSPAGIAYKTIADEVMRWT